MIKFILHFILLFSISQQTFAEQTANPYLDALPAWQATLTEFVDEQGRTDFIALAKKSDNLKQFLKAISQVSPKSHPELFPTKEQQLAFHINAYNALAMWGIVERGHPEHFNSFFKRASFFKFRSVIIANEKTNLYDYENKVIRKFNEPRVHFSLNCMVKDCPKLPKTTFYAKTLERDLQAGAIELFNSSKYVQVNTKKQHVALSSLLKFYTEDYVASGKKKDLIAYANQYRKEKIPENYRVSFLDYDWTVNHQP